METGKESTRRAFMTKLAIASAGALGGIYLNRIPAFGKTDKDSAGKGTLDRDKVIRKLRESIKKLLGGLEARTGLTVEFKSLDRKFGVVAQYDFKQPNRPIVFLRPDWEDVDAAHELVHMRLELVDRYSVLAWRAKVRRDKPVEKAFGLIRSYVDDTVVFQRLYEMGLKIDGEIIKHQFFDDICTKVPMYLKEGRSLRNDGMAHFDNFTGGRYGDLRRSAFLVQAELIMRFYGDRLSGKHMQLVKDFIQTFRRFRRRQANKADKVLGYFKKDDVYTVEGHSRILSKWAELEDLNTRVGLSSYVAKGGGFVLPFPKKDKTRSQSW